MGARDFPPGSIAYLLVAKLLARLADQLGLVGHKLGQAFAQSVNRAADIADELDGRPVRASTVAGISST